MIEFTETRNKLWFNCYTRSVLVPIPYAYALHHKGDRIDQYLQRRSSHGLYYRNPNKQDIENLHRFRDFMDSTDDDYRITLAHEHIYIYTNSQEFVDKLLALDFIDKSTIISRTLMLEGDPNSILLKNPKHKYRVYLREISISEYESKNLTSYLKSQENIRLGPAFKDWIKSDRKFWWVGSYFFFDCDDLKIPNMLALVQSRIVRKIVPIVQG